MPILKSRRAELESLRLMGQSLRERIRPLVELTRPPSVPEATPPEGYLEGLARRLLEAWGNERTILVDTRHLPESTSQAAYLELFAELALDHSIRMIPVTGPERPADHIATARRIGRERGMGMALRVPIGTDGPDSDLESTILQIGSTDGMQPENCDLILDFGSIAEEPVLKVARGARRALAALPGCARWRSFVTAFGGFPVDLSNFRPRTAGTIERKDWQVWCPIASNHFGRLPTFGDYAIAWPGLPAAGHAAPLSLRYATFSEWQIIKGPAPGVDDGWFKDACNNFVSSELFCGPTFSSGDLELSERVGKNPMGGNASNWRAIGTSHHLALVAKQVDELTSASDV